MEKFLNVALLIRISEEQAEGTILLDLFNEAGESIGAKPTRAYEDEVESVKGKRVLFVEAQCGGKKAIYQSPPVEENNLSIANALVTCLIPIAQSLVRQFRVEKEEPKLIISPHN